jgi:hypothetical protein
MHRIGMFDVFVCYMHVLDVFEVIYMDIYVFTILKCRKLKKKKILWALCRAYAHSKGPFDHFAVRIRTAMSPRGAHLCVMGAG